MVHDTAMQKVPGIWIAAGYFVFAYAILLAISALFFHWCCGEWGGTLEVIRLIIRILLSLLVAAGLWSGQRWAYWLGLIGGILLALLGMLVVTLIFKFGIIDSQPYPQIAKAFFVSFCLTPAGAALLLLSPSGRRGLKVQKEALELAKN